MNVRDSETLAGTLQEMGFAQAERDKADIVLYNTCCVRENAENRALGNVIWLKELKKERPDMVIGVCGCMIQEEGVAERLQKQYPFIDQAFGTHNAYRFPEYLYQVLLQKSQVFAVEESDGVIAEGLPALRSHAHSAVCEHHVWLQQFLFLLYRTLMFAAGSARGRRQIFCAKLRRSVRRAQRKSLCSGRT